MLLILLNNSPCNIEYRCVSKFFLVNKLVSLKLPIDNLNLLAKLYLFLPSRSLLIRLVKRCRLLGEEQLQEAALKEASFNNIQNSENEKEKKAPNAQCYQKQTDLYSLPITLLRVLCNFSWWFIIVPRCIRMPALIDLLRQHRSLHPVHWRKSMELLPPFHH